jgi:hypothetical protein
LLLGLSLRAAVAGDAAEAGLNAPSAVDGLRLSGIVTVAGEPRYAVVEAPGGDGRLVQAGDTLPDGSQVLAIGPDWVRLSARGEERLLHIVGLPADAPRPVRDRTAAPLSHPQGSAARPTSGTGIAAPASDSPSLPGALTADGRLGEDIARVMGVKRRPIEAVADVIGDHLGLPVDAAIVVTDRSMNPLRDSAAAKAELDQGNMLKVLIGSGEEQHMLYLMPPPLTAPDSGSQGE